MKDSNGYEYSGYTWEGGWNNEAIIRSTDDNYIANGLYYLLIHCNNQGNEVTPNSYSSYTIAVNEDDQSLLLTEGIGQKMTLNSYHECQNYHYLHSDRNQPVYISINFYMGTSTLNVTINGKKVVISQEIRYSYYEPFHYFIISKEDLKENCPKTSLCPIELSFERTSYYDTRFLIMIKSSENKEERLSPSVTREVAIYPGETQKFTFDVMPDPRIGAKISLRVESGSVKAYAKIDKRTNFDEDIEWPSEKVSEYQSTRLSEKIESIDIPYKDIKDLNPAKVLLTVKGERSGVNVVIIQYSITFTTTSKPLNINELYNINIFPGEIQLYNFEITDPENDRLYISMSNKLGDADMYLNYGKTFPSFAKYNWKSTGAYTESIDISSSENFFLENGLPDLTGKYSLMIYGYLNTSYTLYIGNSKYKFISIKDDLTASCSCKSENDSCYFRYEVFEYFNIKKVSNKDIIFSIDYTYGSGSIYAKLFESGNNEVIFKNLPNETNYDFKNKKDSFIDIHLDENNPKLTIDSQLILNVQCHDKSLFDFNAVNVKSLYGINKQYISVGRNNIFSVKGGEEQLFQGYAFNSKDVNFEVKVYQGEINCTVYTNATYLGASDSYDYQEIDKFVSKDSDPNSHLNYVPKDKLKDNYIYFNVKPKVTSLFLVKFEYDEEWVRVPIGQTSSYTFANSFNGYFDSTNSYSCVPKCPNSTYIDGKYCTLSCNTEQMIVFDN